MQSASGCMKFDPCELGSQKQQYLQPTKPVTSAFSNVTVMCP